MKELASFSKHLAKLVQSTLENEISKIFPICFGKQ
jgi:hypothetical protein